MQLKPEEFIRRFLSHVVPHAFMRIRNFGFLANASKAKKIARIRQQLKAEPPQIEKKKDVATLMLELTGQDIALCPFCGQGKLQRISELPSKFSNTVFDTS